VTDIGSVSQSFKVFNKESQGHRSSVQNNQFEDNFGEIFSRVAGKTATNEAVTQKSRVTSPEINGYGALELKPKNKKWDELEKDTLDKLTSKLKMMVLRWSQEKREGRQ
jgi:hypothetical protein